MPSGMKPTISPVCTAQVACEGAYVIRKNKPAATICGKCEKTLEDRKKVIPPRGHNYRE